MRSLRRHPNSLRAPIRDTPRPHPRRRTDQHDDSQKRKVCSACDGQRDCGLLHDLMAPTPSVQSARESACENITIRGHFRREKNARTAVWEEFRKQLGNFDAVSCAHGSRRPAGASILSQEKPQFHHGADSPAASRQCTSSSPADRSPWCLHRTSSAFAGETASTRARDQLYPALPNGKME